MDSSYLNVDCVNISTKNSSSSATLNSSLQFWTVKKFKSCGSFRSISKTMLPIKTLDEVEEIYEKIQTASFRIALVRKLLRGATKKKGFQVFVRKILQRLMTNDLALKYTWIGSRSGKMPFRYSPLKLVVMDAFFKDNTFESIADSDVEDVIKIWLKGAQKRISDESLHVEAREEEEEQEEDTLEAGDDGKIFRGMNLHFYK